MLKLVRSHLTYANVVATGALFVALGGGAYALSGVPDRSGVYHGCVASTGALRVVTKASSCVKAKTVKRGKRLVRIPGESAIAWNQQGPSAFLLNRSLRLFRIALLFRQIDNRHVGALASEQDSDRAANAGIAPGNQGDLIRQLLCALIMARLVARSWSHL